MRRSAAGAGYWQSHEVSVSCSGTPRPGAPPVNENRRAEEHPVVVGVDDAVVVGVAEELDEVERAAVSREDGLARLSGQRDLDGGGSAGTVEPHRLEALRGVRCEGGSDALDGARDRHVDEPAPVGGDRGARQVAREQGTRRERRADRHVEDAQVALDRLPADERDVARVDPLGLQGRGRIVEATASVALRQGADAELPGGPFAERDVEQVLAVGADARPRDVRVVVEELPGASVGDALREELVGRVPVGHEVERPPVGAQLAEQVVRHADGQALGQAQDAIRLVVLRARASGPREEDERGRGCDRTPGQHVFPAHVPSSPSTHPPQTTFRTWACRQVFRRSSAETSERCSCIHRHS